MKYRTAIAIRTFLQWSCAVVEAVTFYVAWANDRPWWWLATSAVGFLACLAMALGYDSIKLFKSKES